MFNYYEQKTYGFNLYFLSIEKSIQKQRMKTNIFIYFVCTHQYYVLKEVMYISNEFSNEIFKREKCGMPDNNFSQYKFFKI